ncbi:CocE/NonD family hydrolase [Acetobacter fallax]|uniref:CocE/NonD family hydrolase n=1 Tax=Acetobacter fallax TaxID=1737473 RepID=A0ABX0KEP3_9PROT|nr:CocE/NonD family hydrolase [Acetobacter fallax]NHO33606.1 CocE/NonD family hydrolase [Acetobacter fallax]NHO37193.1 CocE/NonD family hydrolase [Acetobacter fallax]
MNHPRPAHRKTTLALAALLPLTAALSSTAHAAQPDPLLVQTGNDIPPHVTFPTDQRDYIKREAMIPMRDGVKLYTVIVIPKSAKSAPILLTRTPYHAKERASRTPNAFTMRNLLPQGDDVFVEGGYIRVFQDIRGKYGSEGDYVMTRPPRGPLNPTSTDETTDAWDTIDWLVKNTPESNGRVGMTGSSYEGFTVVMALLDPHPALKVAAPESPMVDGWMGDDWFHYGAFRQGSLDYFTSQMTVRGESDSIPRIDRDDYTNFLKAGSTEAFAQKAGLDQFPFWQRMHAHPAYDQFWQEQALDKLLAKRKPTVPTLWEQGLWDQEDMWGAIHSWEALKATAGSVPNTLVMGPWRHSGVNYNGSALGPLAFEGDTAEQYRRDVFRPFFDQYLKPGAPAVTLPSAIIYNTGLQRWDRYAKWPLACETGCNAPLRPLYLSAGNSLSFTRPATDAADTYISDPAHPAPFVHRPFAFSESAKWKPWLVQDQREAESRPDVLTYETAPLDAPVTVSGSPVADLYAATTGTDSDWVVKLIDVNLPTTADTPDMGGYELAVSMDIFRGRYRKSFSQPSPIEANKTEHYRFTLPGVNHVFAKGHRIMVQIQSSWFPLYDRNPQHYVENIFDAKPADYIRATQSIHRGGAAATSVLLPVVPATGK